jgi:hypothetical protein
MKYIRISLIFSILLFSLFLRAGWVITGRYIDRDGNTVLKRFFIEDNQVKVERYNLIYSCNLKTGSIILVDPVKLIYCRTSLSALTDFRMQAKMKNLNTLIRVIPEAQQQEYRQKYSLQAETELNLSRMILDSLTVKEAPDTVKLLGHRVSKYLITRKNLKKEEFFLTREVDLSAEWNFTEFLKFVYQIEPDDKTTLYQASADYLNLVSNGLVMRRFMFEDGYRSEWQVNLLEEKNIPDYEFGIPALCKEVSLAKWFTNESDSDPNSYDDYE